MNSRDLFQSIKEKFKKGDKIVLPEDRYDAETGFKRKQIGTILNIFPRYVLVRTKNYPTTVHNHVMLTNKQVKKVNR